MVVNVSASVVPHRAAGISHGILIDINVNIDEWGRNGCS